MIPQGKVVKRQGPLVRAALVYGGRLVPLAVSGAGPVRGPIPLPSTFHLTTIQPDVTLLSSELLLAVCMSAACLLLRALQAVHAHRH